MNRGEYFISKGLLYKSFDLKVKNLLHYFKIIECSAPDRKAAIDELLLL